MCATAIPFPQKLKKNTNRRYELSVAGVPPRPLPHLHPAVEGEGGAEEDRQGIDGNSDDGPTHVRSIRPSRYSIRTFYVFVIT